MPNSNIHRSIGISTGYKMIESLNIEHFRAFEEIHLSGLARVNVIVGPNASGKTALLEAVSLGTRAAPPAAFSLWQNRSMAVPLITAPENFKAFWSSLFFESDSTKPIEISFKDTNNESSRLRIFFGPNEATPFIVGGIPNTMASGPIIFERSNQNGQKKKLRSFITQQGQVLNENAEPLGPVSAFFSSSAMYNAQDNVNWFSALSQKNLENEVIDIMQREFPAITSLSILNSSGIQGIYAGYMGKSHKMPINMISSGIQKVLSIVLASVSYKGGIIIIDEIENGIFYRRFSDIWSIIYSLATQNDNQIFVSTHSLECVKSILPLLEKHPNDFCLLRSESLEDGSKVEQFYGSEFAAAIKQGFDPRGVERSYNEN